MKLDNKEKYQRIRRFVNDIKLKPNIEPFLFTEEIAKFGIYDFYYINKNPSSFTKVEKKLKDSKYDELAQFVEDLKQIFISVADYAFESDPIQHTVNAFKEQIDRFAQKFVEDFKSNIIRPKPQIEVPQKKQKVEPPKPARSTVMVEEVIIRDRPTNILEKLEMLFLLRANQNNEPYIRSIGSAYQIGSEVGDEYVIVLDNKNTSWMQFLSKHE